MASRVNRKMYVIGGYGKTGEAAPAMVYEYDPGPDKWTKKKSTCPLPSIIRRRPS